MKKVSLICTTYNEEHTILLLLRSLISQYKTPDEIIICDGGSTDNTVNVIRSFSQQHPHIPIFLIQKKGSIGAGRNAAVKSAQYPLLAITDAGCIPEKNWLKELLHTYEETKAPVIAGFYRGIAKTDFEEAVIPYVLVMPDKLNVQSFLPATRSMLIEKSVWEKLGGLNEKLAASEDYTFAHQIKKAGITIAVAPKAIVGWLPRKNVLQFFKMMFAFAKYDMQGNVLRTKVVLVFIRYIILFSLILFFIIHNTIWAASILIVVSLVIYAMWSIQKNKRYVPHGWYWLPVLQITGDFALMFGTIAGLKLIYKK